MKVLVTGATGRLGTVVCQALAARGHDVLGTDRRFAAGVGVPLRLADLRDARAVYPLLEGRDALVHLGNIPSLGAGPSPQAVLAENVAMNSNVFRAALDLGLRRIVFASSLQAMIRLEEGSSNPAPYTIPYLPLDGAAPADPGYNFYGLSKEFGERTLRVLAARFPELACTALRFPMLVGEAFLSRLKQPLPISAFNRCEALTYLRFTDAATLVGLVLERQGPGYHQYFPAQALEVEGLTPAAVVTRYFPGTPLRQPLETLTGLVDASALRHDFGFEASPPLRLKLADEP